MTPAETRLALWRNGYLPLAVNGKEPAAKAWQAKTETNAEEIALHARIFFAASNTGILTRRVPAIDIDITLLPAAGAIERLADETFDERGFVMVRVGQAPKRAVLLRTDEPFPKLSRVFVAPDKSKQKIEVLGDGQQVVVNGIHPDTHKPYIWHGGSPLDVPRDDLPYVRREDMERFLDAAPKVLADKYCFTAKRRNSSAKGNGADHGAHPHADWSELIGNILAGHDLHDSGMRLAAAYIASGMSEDAARRTIEALFLTSDTPRDERWKARFDDIGRAVQSASEKFAKPQKAEQSESCDVKSQDMRSM